MTTGVGLLCSRVRVEEKGILAALNGAGIPGCTIAPDQPLPAPPGPGPLSGPAVVIDRYADRTAAGVVLGLLAVQGVTTVDAGLAARTNRAETLLTLQAAGLPRPRMFVAIGETAALRVAAEAGCPTTLLPLVAGAPGITLWDDDTAEAVLEHRCVLGGATENVFILQHGAPDAGDRVLLTVVDGTVVGAETAGDLIVGPDAIALATQAARVLRGRIVGIELTRTASGWVVWDVEPVPDFRMAVAVGGVSSVGQAVADLAGRCLAERSGGTAPVQLLHHAPAERPVGEFVHSV